VDGSRLIGRPEASAQLRALLEGAEAGSGGGLVIDGIAGIGKTAVLEFAAATALAGGFEVWHARGVAIESDLAFGALESVFADHRVIASRHNRPSAPALREAISRTGVRDELSYSWRQVAGEAIELLSQLGRSRPQLVVVDDVQWADSSSVAVLGHVARHVVADRVAVVFARRSADRLRGAHDAALAAIATLRLRALTVEESVDALLQLGVVMEDALRWAPLCGGLPLALTEVARCGLEMSPDEQIVGVLTEHYRNQISALSVDTIEALHVLALSDDASLLRPIIGDSALRSLRSAIELGAVEIRPDDAIETTQFRHPLIRAAVLGAATPDQQRTMHRRVAAALAAAGDVDRSAVHLAAAANGQNANASLAMTTLAERAMARGALPEGARAFRRAAELATDLDSRSRLLERAADASFDHGDFVSAFPLIDEAVRIANDPRVAADARSLRAKMSIWAISPASGVHQLLEIAHDMRSIDVTRAASALVAASAAGHLHGDFRGAIECGREAERLATEVGDVETAIGASAMLAFNGLFVGNWDESDQRLQPLEPIMRALLATRSWTGIHLAEMFGTAWVCAERWDDAEPLIRELLHVSRSLGVRLKEASVALLLGSLCWRKGRWDEAYALERPLLDYPDVPPVTLAWMRVLVAQLTATMGRVEETRELAGLGLPVALAAGAPIIVAMAHAALGHLELSLGNNDTALGHLDRTATALEDAGFVEPEYFPWQGDHLEALVRAGRRDEAAHGAARLAKLGVGAGRRWAVGVAARVDAQLASNRNDANLAFENSISAFESLGMPFEVARTLLARGGQRDLADARRLFLRLGASKWVDACGPRSDRHDRTASLGDSDGSRRLLEMLSPAERDVALAVASGRTNREIAAELHLSVKTVDHYLQHAYRRLGLRNRTELATAIARSISPPSR
jgi:DNA-binding CsgD family transcriptional regulator